MNRSKRAQELARLPVGAILTLLAALSLAPSSARAACSHLVKSIDDRAHSAGDALVLSAIVLDGKPSANPDGTPAAPSPKPCSGAWCTGQPAVPLVPSGVFEGRIGMWALSSFLTGGRSAEQHFLTTNVAIFHPVGQVEFIFHPPRPSSFPA